MNFESNHFVFDNPSLKSKASNILFGENPPFDLEDFYSIYPQFRNMESLPVEVVEMYVEFANEVVNVERWGKQWKMGMCLFIAHFCTIYLMTFQDEGSPAAAVIASAQTKGLVSSKSVGDVSVSYDFSLAVQDVQTWGQFNLTSFGNQFVSLAKMMSKGPMYVW